MLRSSEFPIYEYKPDQYNLGLMRGEEIIQRSYNLTNEILLRIPSNCTLVDVGCGSAVKLLPLARHAGNIIAFDKNPSVVREAQKQIISAGLKNISVAVTDGNQLPLPNESVEMITYMLCPHNAHETLRVLKSSPV